MTKTHRAICNITKQAIENLEFSDTKEFLNGLLENPRELQEELTFGVGGYVDDQRELWEIPEVRFFMKIIDEDFPFWFHFCNKEDETLKWISLSLIEITPYNGINIITNENLQKFAMIRFKAMTYIHQKNNYRHDETLLMTKKVLEYIKKYIPLYPQRNG